MLKCPRCGRTFIDKDQYSCWACMTREERRTDNRAERDANIAQYLKEAKENRVFLPQYQWDRAV